jgi:hypothetical protein
VNTNWIKNMRGGNDDGMRVGAQAAVIEDAIREVYRVHVSVARGDDRDDVRRAIRRKLNKRSR